MTGLRLAGPTKWIPLGSCWAHEWLASEPVAFFDASQGMTLGRPEKKAQMTQMSHCAVLKTTQLRLSFKT